MGDISEYASKQTLVRHLPTYSEVEIVVLSTLLFSALFYGLWYYSFNDPFSEANTLLTILLIVVILGATVLKSFGRVILFILKNQSPEEWAKRDYVFIMPLPLLIMLLAFIDLYAFFYWITMIMHSKISYYSMVLMALSFFSMVKSTMMLPTVAYLRDLAIVLSRSKSGKDKEYYKTLEPCKVVEGYERLGASRLALAACMIIACTLLMVSVSVYHIDIVVSCLSIYGAANLVSEIARKTKRVART